MRKLCDYKCKFSNIVFFNDINILISYKILAKNIIILIIPFSFFESPINNTKFIRKYILP